MNKLQLFRNRCKAKDTIRIMNRHRNCLKWGSNETDAHIQSKLEICKALKRSGKEFYTEAIFTKGGRADIVNADDLRIYEVLESEKMQDCFEKSMKYPDIFEIILVVAGETSIPEVLI